MRFIGIDIASERHLFAVVDEQGQTLVKATSFTEDAEGYGAFFAAAGAAEGALVALEATGHYWKNLIAALIGHGFKVAVINPLRTHRFAGEELERTKTDALDALSIARFAAQKRPAPTRLPDEATEELRELAQHRARMEQDLGDRRRQLHRIVDLVFPEFTRHVKTIDSRLATTLLSAYPTAWALRGVPWRQLTKLRYTDNHTVLPELAKALVKAAMESVGQHHGPAYDIQVRHICEDVQLLRQRLADLDADIESRIDRHEVGKLLMTIDGIGPTSAARIIARVGDPALLESANALAAFVGVVPGLRQSGKRSGTRASLSPLGDSKLRAALWMPTLVAVRRNVWLKAHYERLLARGKLPKVALVACMRKLLCAVYSVAKHRKPFVPILAAATA